METNHNTDYDQIAQPDNEYAGYTSDKKWGNTNKEFSQTDPAKHEIEDARLADSGPVRNPNYHNLTSDNPNSESPSNRYSALKQKTLQDFNKTEPKREINETDLTSEQSEYTNNDQSDS